METLNSFTIKTGRNHNKMDAGANYGQREI
jgi:hypothetical protein